MTLTTPTCPSYIGSRFPAEIISHAVWLYLYRCAMMNGSARNRGCFPAHVSSD